jgi:TP901-1 family phage major tail protein
MPLAPPINGSDFLVQVNTGTEAAPVWATVGSQRDATVSRSRDTINVSSKDSMARRVKAGEYSYEVSFDHLYVPGAAEMDLLRTAIRNGSFTQLREFRGGVAGRVFGGIITGHEESFPHQGEAVVSVTFTGDDFETA